MADKEKNVVLNFKMDGQVQYAETIREINAVMNTAAKEYKNHIAAMGKDADMTDKLAAEKKKLEIQMEAAQKRTKMLSDQYEAMSKDTKTTTGQLTQMYGKLLDAEKAEIALQKSMDRVNGGLSDQAQEARKAQQELDDLKQENQLLESEQRNLTSSFKLQNEMLDEYASESEKAELAQKQLTQQMDLSERTVKNLEKQLDSAKKVYGENSVEVMQFETKLNDARTTVAKFNKSIDGIEDSSDNAGDGLDELNKKMSLNNIIEATELLQGLTDKLLELGQASFESALQFGDAQVNLQANLGLTGKEAERLNDVVDQVFRHGVVGSLEEATEAVILTKQTFEDLDDVELENITNKFTTIAKRTGTDVQENVRGAEQMMIAFGLSGEKALNLIATGYQNGLNRSGDFMDTLIEYSPQFQQAGFSAEEMLNIINNGLDDGAFNADKAADAVKEFGVFLNDGTIADNITLYSKESRNLFKEYEKGKATAAEVFRSMSNDITKTEKKQKQYEMGVTAFGTMYEDLGVKAVQSFAKTGGAIDEVNGKADEMAQKSPGEQWESSLRELRQSLLPIGNNLIDAFTPVVDVLAKMGKWFSELPAPIQTFITVFGGVTTLAGIAIPIILGLAAAITALEVPLLPIIAIVLGVAAAIAGVILVIKNWGKIVDWLSDLFSKFGIDLSAVWENIRSVIETVVQAVSDFVMSIWGTLVSWWEENNELIMETVSVIWNRIKEVIENAMNVLVPYLQTAWAYVKLVILTVWEFIKGYVKTVMDYILGIIKVVMKLITGDWKGAWEALKDTFATTWDNIKNTVSNVLGAIKDNIGDVWEGIKSLTAGVWETIKNSIMNPINTARDVVENAIEAIKGFMDFEWSLPELKTPKVSVDMKTNSWGIPYPDFDIDWRAKGGIFTQPTIFGASNGRLQGAGEDGPEAVLPLNEKTLGDIGEGIAKTMAKTSGTTQHITIVSPDPTSPSENARKILQAQRQWALEW